MTVEYLQIEPTTRCNFTCGFCCGRSMTQSDLDYDLFERALAQFPSVRHVELQGEGEPLLYPRFFDMLAHARQRGIAVSFITNGSLIDDRAIAQILAGGVDKISVSLESADPTTFRAIRGGKLEKVIANLERLMAAKRARGATHPLVGFSVTMLRSTKGHLDGILALYQRLGLDGGITTQPLQTMSAYTVSYRPDIAAELLTEKEADYRFVRFHRKVRPLSKPTWSEGGFYAELMTGWRPTSRTCPWLERGLYVNRDGVATACCMIKDERHALGRIGDPPEAIEARRAAMRAQLARGEVPAPCEGCQIARYAAMGKVDLARRAVRVGLRVLRDMATE